MSARNVELFVVVVFDGYAEPGGQVDGHIDVRAAFEVFHMQYRVVRRQREGHQQARDEL